ncbi:hypothetical protein [Paractinoplanes toevensis]|uniref:Uncharacterized protein n=1 Tax=Paractinoplanes toevensis TaxID=571911 RepID=A0A919T8W2_9ACTN|nr:hypothetical protein [Actinoplanes toevensis]GIM89711.1 hypothetical protein Ato02nite_015040 [Actinoplanes toevensis]
MTSPFADDMLAQIRALTAALPTRRPTLMRIGPGVLDELKRLGTPVLSVDGLSFGVTILEQEDYPIGQWRIFDQHGEEISAGVLHVIGATVPVSLDDGSSKDMVVVDVRDGHAYVADPVIFDDFIPPLAPLTGWFYGRRAW